MKAGRELDALIAEKVFGQTIVYVGGHPHLTEGNDNYLGGDCPYFSTRIADAWLVVEKMRGHEKRYNFGIEETNKFIGDDLTDGWEAYFCDDDYSNEGFALTAPLAICLAALRAVE